MNVLLGVNNAEVFDRRKFLFLFVVSLVLFQGIAFLAAEAFIVQSTLAQVAGAIYALFDAGIIVDGNKLIDASSGRFVVVDQKCTAFSLIATLSALLVSFPNLVKNKIKSILWVVLFIQIENMFRINHLFYLVVIDNQSFDFYHLYLWQGINFIYAITLLFFVYLTYYSKASSEVY